MAKANVWRTIAIIFIVLFIMETLLIIWFYAVGSKSIDNENECSINICSELEEATSYQYDEYEQICYCMNTDGDVIKQQFIK